MDSDQGKLFIGGVSWETTEEKLTDYFKSYGEVVEAVIMRDRTTGRARGFGFVVFADPAVADRILQEKHTIDGRVVEARKAVPREEQHNFARSNSSDQMSAGQIRTKKIFVGGLASSVTEEEFKKYFEQFGIITDVVVMYDHNTQRPRGFGFITFDSEDAVDKVLQKTFHEIHDKMVEVKRAVPKELSAGPAGGRAGAGGFTGSGRGGSFGTNAAYGQGYNTSPGGAYGARVDNRYGPPAGGRGGYPSYAGYGSTGYEASGGYGAAMNGGYGPGGYTGAAGYGGAGGYGGGYSTAGTGYGGTGGYGSGVVPSGGYGSAPVGPRSPWGAAGTGFASGGSPAGYGTTGGGAASGYGSASWVSGGTGQPAGGSTGYSTGYGYGAGETGYNSTPTGYGPPRGGTSGYGDAYNGAGYGDPAWRSGVDSHTSAAAVSGGASTANYAMGAGTGPDGIVNGPAGFSGGYGAAGRQTQQRVPDARFRPYSTSGDHAT